jgi:tetratricopeptide (TPR) repeat protein
MSFWKDLWSGSLPSQNTGSEESSGTKPSPPSTPPPLPTAVRPRAKNTAHQESSSTKPSPPSTPPPLPTAVRPRAKNTAHHESSRNKPSPPSTPPQSPTAGRARAKYEEGMRLRDSDDWKDKRAALEAFMDAARIDPNFADAHAVVAKAFYNIDPEKHLDTWRGYAEHAFSVDPTHQGAQYLVAAAHFLDGKRFWESERWDEAYDAYKRSFELQPNDSGVFSMLEYVSNKAKREAEFADLCQDWLDEHPDDHAKRYALGVTSFRLALESNDSSPGQEWIQPEFFRRARTALRQYVRDRADCPNGHFQLGKVYLSMRENELARKEFNTLVRLDASKAAELKGYFDHLGVSVGDPSSGAGTGDARARAEARFKEGMRLVEPDRSDSEGFEYVDTEDFNKGLGIIEEAWQIDSSFIDPPLTMAGLYHRMDPKKNCERILSLADAAMALDPNNPEAKQMASLAYFTKAQALMDKKEWMPAADYFRRAHELEPFDAQALSVFRLAAVEADQYEAFVGICEAHLEKHPNDQPVRYTLARALINWAMKAPTAPDAAWLKDKLLGQAEDQLRKYLAVDPLQPDANFWLACALILRQRYDEARQIAVKLLDIDPAKGKDLVERLKVGLP